MFNVQRWAEILISTYQFQTNVRPKHVLQSSSLCSASVLLSYLMNGCSRARQNLQLNWFGRAHALTFLADLCTATAGTGSNNPPDPTREAEDG